MSDKRILLGAIAGAHGIKGEFKVKTFTARAEDVAAYGALEMEDGRALSLKVIRVLRPDLVIARAEGVQTRNDAEALKGEKLYGARAALPATEEDEFYVEDLVGLRAETEEGGALGRVAGVYNFGAGDVVELADVPGAMGTVMLPFTKEAVARVDLAAGTLTISAEALEEISGDEPSGGTKPPSLSDETGEIVSDDAQVDLDAMREEDA